MRLAAKLDARKAARLGYRAAEVGAGPHANPFEDFERAVAWCFGWHRAQKGKLPEGVLAQCYVAGFDPADMGPA